MIVTMIPYCPSEHGANLGFAYNELVGRLSDDDWACFVDHDACFTTSQWYRQLETITSELPEPCVLTARTNRVGSRWQLVEGVDPNNHSIEYHRCVGHKLMERYGTALRDVTNLSLMSGVVILLSTRTWRVVGGFANGFFGVDNAIHHAARERGYKVYLMEGVYVYHWYRADGKMPGPVASSAEVSAGDTTTTVRIVESQSVVADHSQVQCPPVDLSNPTPNTDVVASPPRSLRLVSSPVGSILPEAHYEPRGDDAVAEEVRIVAVADLEERAPQLVNGSLDCVECGHALSQLRRPSDFLEKAHDWLTEEGSLIASFVNVADHRMIAGLLEGRWNTAVLPGAATETVRFFTKREIEKLLYRTGFAVDELKTIGGERYKEWQAAGRPGEVRLGRLQIGGLRSEDAEQFYASEYRVRATRVPQREYGLTSIIIVTHNQMEYTRQCVNSILQLTDAFYELVFVDNGSTDGTVRYLQALEGATVICNDDNLGFPGAANQGMRASRGTQVLLLNNDTVVTTGWLDRLLRALYSEDRIGLVGPCSNQVSGPQRIETGYTDLSSLDGFAWEWGKSHRDQIVDIGRLVGFCLLVRRSVIEEIGHLDERFGIGNYEDDDFCLRARRAGYQTVIALDAFVHHFGGRTFVASDVDFDSLMKENKRLFDEKWQEDASTPAQRTGAVAGPSCGSPRPFRAQLHESGGLLLIPSKARLSLAMIVRDNEGILNACLDSIMPWVDEIVIVDTGSHDRTPEIAAKYGAHVYHFPWCDDFAAARNESLRHAHGDWVFWMDSDDTIDCENGRKLRDLASRDSNPDILGYVMQVHCPSVAGEQDVTIVDHVKMFRNRADLRFECRIHEQILPAIRRAGGEVAFTDIFVTHSGADHSVDGLQRKRERDLRLLRLELKDRPDHPFALFNLGMTLADTEDYEGAIEALERSLTVSAPDESHVRKVYALLATCYSQLERFDDGRRICQEGRRHFPRDPELAFREGMLAHHFDCHDEAVEAYEDALANSDARHFSSIDLGITGYKARHNMAIVFADQNRWDDAIAQWRRVISEIPTYREAWRGLTEALLRKGAISDLEELSEQAETIAGMTLEARLIRARVAKARGDFNLAKRLFEETVQNAAVSDLEPLCGMCQFLFEHGEPREALQAISELIQRDPEDASAHHNLGTTLLRMGAVDAAIEAFKDSLELRPESATTASQLGLALRDAGRLEKAIEWWKRALELDPEEAIARRALSDHRRIDPRETQLVTEGP